MPPAGLSDDHPLSEVLERLKSTRPRGDRLVLADLLEATGERSFGMALLIPALLLVSPLSGVPGFPSALAVGIFLIAAQLLIGRDHFWLPEWLLKRSVEQDHARKALDWMGRPAHWIERLSRPRLKALTRGPGKRLAAAMSLLLALVVPPLDVVPTANSITGLALLFIALSLVLCDGLFLLIALGVMSAGGVAAAVTLL